MNRAIGLAQDETEGVVAAKNTEGTEHVKKEIQSYIEIVGKNDLDNRKDAYAKPALRRSSPGWKTR